ncbi:MAG: AMP-binding protein [Prevotellaceae bacterium]|jgi:acyl-coenzyme A synthetase/AMP-(fatty) acid ligase|nr:AMP-binding protein [Prevotellaceae bacterium]
MIFIGKSNEPVAINEQREIFSYADVNRIIATVCEKVPSRSLVFCLCTNSFGALSGYMAFINQRIVPVMLDAKTDRELLKNLLSKYKPSFVWTPHNKSDDFDGWKPLISVYDYVLLKNPAQIYHTIHEDLALLLTTSGSTGSPKFTRISYQNLQSNAESIINYLKIDYKERPITSLPLHYSFGLSVINSHLLCGATILLTSHGIMEKDFWTFLKDEKASSLSGVPYTYEMLKRLRFFRMDLPSLKTLTQAGGKLNTELCREFAEYAQSTGKQFIVMYGQTEATARMSYLPPKQAVSKAGSIGIAIPGGKFSLADENQQPVENSGQTGELVYQGPNVSLGYAESAEDLAKGDENRGILYTGDLAQRDDDGYYYIVGRKKRFIKLFGNRINLDETESVLKSQCKDCACVGTDDKMIIYITEKGKEDEVKQLIATKTNIHFSVFDVRYIISIPKNSSGKTIYTELAL